ncbi:hypothetical protein CASFOL_000915 [Castilleja foliolosa]|uniref:TRF2/HOY1 PH-like domain-containing protein n=1 Tax=Castilleja foliolosa TaxID=1961234 RepID=A0ABD3EPV4_9LAMI
MVQVMKNGGGSEPHSQKMAMVKMELEDSLEEEHGPLLKRPKKNSLGMSGLAVPPSKFNPLDEPSPLGLHLRKSPSLLELIQMKLTQTTSPKVGSRKESLKDSVASSDKLKASNFHCSLLRIGTWEYKSRHEGDLVAKCYFAKHKLVWEVLDGGLKNKIEIQWSDIMALKGTYEDDCPGTLNVVVMKTFGSSHDNLFFSGRLIHSRGSTLFGRQHQISPLDKLVYIAQHYLECPQGLLGKHFEKLMQCDPRLNFLSQQVEITLDSPLQDTASPSGAQSSSSKNDADAIDRHSGSYPRETPSPSSAMDTLPAIDIKNSKIDQLKELSNWDQIMVPGIRSSMSMSDLVSHLENRISVQRTSNNPTLSSTEWHRLQVLDDINRCLFSDVQNLQNSDEEKSLMSRVNSLCCLLQKDNAAPFESENRLDSSLKRESELKVENILNDENEDNAITRKDSVGDLLLNLPRIASLPQFLFNISEDFESHAR